MSFARTGAPIGLVGLGLWLMTTGPVQAGQPSFATKVHQAAAAPVAAAQMPMGTGKVKADCTYKGIKLAGKVKLVERGGDILVLPVASFPDLKVKKVTSFPEDCGEWQFVDSFPDFKIQYVKSFADIEITWVESFAGLPG